MTTSKDISDYKNHEWICSRGRKVRIVCTDFKSSHPVIALAELSKIGDLEVLYQLTEDLKQFPTDKYPRIKRVDDPRPLHTKTS